MVNLQRLRHSLRDAFTARTTLAVFAFLALTSRLPAVVDIYASPVYRILFTPSYLVSMLFYDSPFGLENLVYPISRMLPVDGHLLWEVGKIATFYLFAVAVVWIAAELGVRGRSTPDPATS